MKDLKNRISIAVAMLAPLAYVIVETAGFKRP